MRLYKLLKGAGLGVDDEKASCTIAEDDERQLIHVELRNFGEAAHVHDIIVEVILH